MGIYGGIFVSFRDVDDVSEGGDDVNADAAALLQLYPSGPIVFWKDI